MTIPDQLTSPIIIFIIKGTGSNITTTTPGAVDESYLILTVLTDRNTCCFNTPQFGGGGGGVPTPNSNNTK